MKKSVHRKGLKSGSDGDSMDRLLKFLKTDEEWLSVDGWPIYPYAYPIFKYSVRPSNVSNGSPFML